MAHIGWATAKDPFSYFTTQQEFIDFFTQDKNLIVKERGPGDAVGKGEWYLTKEGKGNASYFLSRVRNRRKQMGALPNPAIDFVRLRGDRILAMHMRQLGPWEYGHRDSWSSNCTQHWKVDFDDILKMKPWSFMNWTDENPLEVK